MSSELTRIRKATLGTVTAVGLFALVEMVAHIALGPPPTPDALGRTAACELRTEEGRTWIECGMPEDEQQALAASSSTSPSSDRPRVVFLGGSSVRDPFKSSPWPDFPDVVGALVPEAEVLNLGRPGVSMSGVAWLVTQLAALNPDLVVLYEGHNDFAQTLFRGRIRGTRMWTVPLLRVLSRSWVYAAVSVPVRGTEPTAAPPGQRRAGPVELPPVCSRPHSGSERRGVVPVTDSTALDVRADVLARYEADLESAIRASPAPVLVSTLLRNFDYPPGGVLAEADSACTTAMACLQDARAGEFAELAVFSAGVCGEGAVTWWLRAHALQEEGRSDEATEAWRKSLALDPVPLRAPAEADEVVRRVAARTGAGVVDLEGAVGPLPPGDLFHDTLHLSESGARTVAGVVAPRVREALQGR